jgi:hypothetical protein
MTRILRIFRCENCGNPVADKFVVSKGDGRVFCDDACAESFRTKLAPDMDADQKR